MIATPTRRDSGQSSGGICRSSAGFIMSRLRDETQCEGVRLRSVREGRGQGSPDLATVLLRSRREVLGNRLSITLYRVVEVAGNRIERFDHGNLR
jgi:hypothetical protein